MSDHVIVASLSRSSYSNELGRSSQLRKPFYIQKILCSLRRKHCFCNEQRFWLEFVFPLVFQMTFGSCASAGLCGIVLCIYYHFYWHCIEILEIIQASKYTWTSVAFCNAPSNTCNSFKQYSFLKFIFTENQDHSSD